LNLTLSPVYPIHSNPLLPVTGLAIQVSNGDDPKLVGFDLAVLFRDILENLISWDKLHLALVDLSHTSLCFFSPKLVNCRLRREIEADEQFLNQTHPGISGK
jgi:hypothetical protein